MSQNRIFSLNSLSHILGGKEKNPTIHIGAWIGTPRAPCQFFTLSDDYWAKAQLYTSNCCHKEMSNNNAQTSTSACYFNDKIFIKALKCLSSSLSFPITHRIVIFSSGFITIKMLLLSNLGSNYTVDRTFLGSIGPMCQKDNNTLWLSMIFCW